MGAFERGLHSYKLQTVSKHQLLYLDIKVSVNFQMVVVGGHMVVFSLQRKKNFVGIKVSKILNFHVVGVGFSSLNSNSRKLFL